jgi:molybdate-binding protein
LADCGLGIEAVARRFRLGFLPLATERFDLAMRRRAYFEPPVQRLLAFAKGEELAARARALGGYDVAGLGTVRFNA